jgi:Fe-S-cluster containining protein
MTTPEDTDETAEVPDCLACGACCFSTLSRYAPVTGDDYTRLDEAAARLVTWEQNRAYMRMEDGHCAALAIDGTSGRFACTVYATRPAICRDLARGSPQCAGERVAKADRPARALAALRAHRS